MPWTGQALLIRKDTGRKEKPAITQPLIRESCDPMVLKLSCPSIRAKEKFSKRRGWLPSWVLGQHPVGTSSG